jgi:serine/threonine protein kinase
MQQKGTLRWQVRSSNPPKGLDRLLADPDRFLQDRTLLIADSPLITLAKVPSLAPGDPELVLRRLNYGRWKHRFRDVFRTSRAERAFHHGLQLELAGINTARNIAAGIERWVCWPRRAYLVTEWVARATTLNDRLARDRSLPRDQVYKLADLLARLHQNGFSHRDLKSSNILFDANSQPCLIDLDGVRAYPSMNLTRTAADLSRFAWEFVKYPSLLKWHGRRFLRYYCKQRSLPWPLSELDALIMKPINQRLEAGVNYWKR